MNTTAASQQFKFSTRSHIDGIWRVFYYCLGMGFETGNTVYYGKNEWGSEQECIESQQQWENRFAK